MVRNFYLFPVGSHGDVHPFLGLACELRRRGHHVTVVTSGLFQDLVERCGITFREISDRAADRRLLDDPDLWRGGRAVGTLTRRLIGPLMREHVEWIRRENLGARDVLVAPAHALGVRLTQEAWGLPLVSIHLQPAALWSAHRSPRLGRWSLTGDRVPRWLKEWQFRCGFWLMVDRLLRGSWNALRRELGLKASRIVVNSLYSPHANCGMFPEWFGPPQPDWPQRLILCGFPLWDERSVTPLPSALEEFLRSGDRPIVYTPGTGHTHAEAFWRAAIDACGRLQRRGIFLTRFGEQVPKHLPTEIRYFDFCPFSVLLPRVAAIVHHGGIGTLSQALAAGVPQLIMPMAFDQPDNAARIQALGVGDFLWPSALTGGRLATKLDRLLRDADVAASCRSYQSRLVGESGIDKACQVLEQTAGVAAPS